MDLWNHRNAITVANKDKKQIPHLPDDLIHLILTRLPAKSVLRFRSVAKHWNTLISNPRFTRHHQIISSRRNPTTFLVAFPAEFFPRSTLVWIAIDRYANSILVDREAYDRSSVREFTCAPRIVSDACHGVFCVTSGTSVAFWNPATREVRVVGLNWKNLAGFVGFGCLKDQNGNVVDFKLLGMLSRAKQGFLGDFVVYSLQSNSCSSIDGPSFPLEHFMHFGSVCFNGVLHWLARCGETGKEAYILTFDLVSHTFGKIDLPHTDGIRMIDRDKNFLTVTCDQYLSFGMVDRESDCLNLWVMCDIDGRRSWVSRERVGPLTNTGLMLRYSDYIGGVITQTDLEGRFGYHTGENASKHETGLYGLTRWAAYSESLISLKRIANGQQDNLDASN